MDDGIARIIESGRPPSVHGSNKGPGGRAAVREMTIERMDLKREVDIVGQRLESQGFFSGPEGKQNYANFMKKHRSIKNRPDEMCYQDWGKNGAPDPVRRGEGDE